MILFIDTTNREQSTLAAIYADLVKVRNFKTPGRLSERLPLAMGKFLKSIKLNITDVKKIVVVRGPGSFIGIRTGVAYANAFSAALNLPILGIQATDVPKDLRDLRKAKMVTKLVTPKYGAPPNITGSPSPAKGKNITLQKK